MTEKTRQLRADAIAEADAKIEGLHDEITALEGLIEEIQRKVPPELPDDREWHLAKLNPIMRQLVKITEKMVQRTAVQYTKDLIINNMYSTDTLPYKVGTQLRVKLPEGFKAQTGPASKPKKD
jgi:archaellum component FlaC